MHLTFDQRPQAMKVLSSQLAPKGLLIITLRHGPNDDQRQFHAVNFDELEQQAGNLMLPTQLRATSSDHLERSNVRWETAVFQAHN